MSATAEQTPQSETAPVSKPEPASEPTTDETTPEPTPEPGEPDEGAQSPVEAVPPGGEPQTAILSEKQMEAAHKLLVKEATRHANELSKIIGEEAQSLVVCELCPPWLAGFRWKVAPDEEVIKAVRGVIGLPTLENLKADPYSRKCDTCDGAGKVASGSLVQGRETLPCVDCKGNGWRAVGPERTPGALVAVPDGQPAAVEAPVDDGIKRDMFGTPEGDPDYGLMPNLRARPIDYWQTHQT